MTWTLVFQIIALAIVAMFVILAISAAITTARKAERDTMQRLTSAERLALHDAEAQMRSIQRPSDGDLLAAIQKRYS